MPEENSDKTIPVKVAVRIRPLLHKEISEACQECISVTPGEPQVIMGTNKAFTYDYVFGKSSSQKELYTDVVTPLLDGFFKGYNATVLAYGQTGSGKTHSMGTSFTVCTSDDEDSQGVIPRLIQDLFRHIEQDKCEYSLKVSFLEIHNEEIHDLLNPSSTDERITIRESCEGGIKIAGLMEKKVDSVQDMVQCLELGSASRVTGATAMNSRSSRSHAIYTIIMEQRGKGIDSDVRKAKFHLVDLAGSERVKKTNAQGERFKEGVNINKGLLCLGNVISALSDEQRNPSTHVPYRDSKLTRLLQDSLGGNSNTLMLACVSPADSNYEETLNTLRYADRARHIKNKPIINRDPQLAEIMRLRQQIEMLQALQGGQLINGSLTSDNDTGGVNTEEMKDRIKELETENTKLSRELHNFVDQNTHLQEKVLLLELTKEKMVKTFEEIRQRTGETAFPDATDERDDEQEDDEGDMTMAQLQSKLAELERTMLTAPDNESILQNESHDAETMDTSDSPASPLNSTYDSQHALRQAELGRQVQELSKALSLKQELANKIMQNEGTMNSKMIKQYEDTVRELETEISKLEEEKAKLATALATAKTAVHSDSDGKAKSRIKELEAKIVELKKKQAEQQKLRRLKEQSDSKITLLNSEIQNMKSTKVKLMRQMREESERFRKLKQEKEKEILQLKQQGRKRQFEYSKLQTMHKKQQAVLKRKTEEANAANKRLKDALQKQREAADKRMSQQSLQNKQSEGMLRRMKSWLSHEVEVLISVNNAKRTLESIIEHRKELSQELAFLRNRQEDQEEQPPMKKILPSRRKTFDLTGDEHTDARIKELEAGMRLRSVQVQELQQKLLDAENGDRSKHRWNNIHTMAEAKACCQVLLQMTIDAKLEEIKFEEQIKENEENLKEFRLLSENAAQRLQEAKEHLTRQHDLAMTHVQKDHEDKIRVLLQQIPSEEEKAEMQRVRQDLEDKKKELERLEVLRQENESLKQQISDMVKVLDNGTPEPEETEALEVDMIDAEVLSEADDVQEDQEDNEDEVDVEEQEEDNASDYEDNIENDPDWKQTPRITRHSSKSRISIVAQQSGDGGCTCKGKCKRNCKCRDSGLGCGSHCSCLPGKCANIPKAPMTPMLFESPENSPEVHTTGNNKPSEQRRVLTEKQHENIVANTKRESNSSTLEQKNKKTSHFSWKTPKKPSSASTSSLNYGSAQKTGRRRSGLLSKKPGVRSSSSKGFMSPHRSVLRTPGSGCTPSRSMLPKALSKAKRESKIEGKAEKLKKRKLHNPTTLPNFVF